MAINQDLLRVWGVGFGFAGTVLCVPALFEWIFKFRRNLRPNKLLALIMVCFFGSLFLTILATRLLLRMPKGVTFASAVISGVALQLSQALLWRCCLQRLHSVLSARTFSPRMTNVATAISSLYCTLVVCFLIYQASLTDGNVTRFWMGKYFQNWYRISDAVDIAIYGAVSFFADMLLLQTLHRNMRTTNRGGAGKALKLKIQGGLVILNLLFKMTDISIKIASLLTVYFPFDTYFRSFSVCFETWTVMKLGITLEEVLTSDGYEKQSTSGTQPTRTETQISKTNILHSPSMPKVVPGSLPKAGP